ncbi:SDR family oxidoreductase [Sutcliffiella cohnii]|uniref:Gluconate 5-dehydrogenase n=1 Tax=Sutcliffiella cohnii TaxID=33932 RepID=A0A223KUP0_9BACI|nr:MULTISPECIES: SDR family oxidoreductase [Sutcliffiella]AST93077.1 gluconate 5-dehydrogenase [Sutcliffiella cohnii]MED4016751.1 SDR family oxidoreductase [Sutcliffiella cohnii]WBL14279.1 SDR family oxidoreductase [Sutcliffiella sp. NC1]
MHPNDLFQLKGKTAIITGGGKGLGAQMANVLARAGANIVICSRNEEICKQTCKQLEEEAGVQTLAISCDVTKGEEIEAVIQATMEKFGQIDILINNSGTSWISPFIDFPEEKWDKVMDVNVKGTFLFSQAVAKVMMKQRKGKIINIASVTGMGGTFPELLDTIAYNTSKGAILTFTKDLAVKLARFNIQVNAIAPGFFPTKITEKVLKDVNAQVVKHIPAGRFGNSDDLKGATLFLASKASDYCIGQVIVIDGGITALV